MERFTGSDMNKLTVATMQVEALRKQAADAQATIAALQTRVKELEQIAISHDQSMRYITGQAKRTHEKLTTVQATLTQRTAECDTARRRVDELEAREVDVVLLREDLERRTAELEAAKRDLGRAYESEKSMDRIMRIEEASSRVMIDRLRAELERVRGLIAALPKVEGEIEIREVAGSFKLLSWPGSGPDVALVCAYNLDEAAAYAALLQERQKLC